MGRPNFIIIGMERCGTTSLYYNICKHSMVTPAYQKELEYFDKHYDKGKSWYCDLFQEGTFTGEATPTYYWNPVVPQRIKEFDPNIKIIVITRPIDEAVRSKYNQQVIKGVENLDFESAINYEFIRILGELSRVEHLPYNYYPSLYSEYAYKDRYSESHLDKWKDFNMLKLELDDLKNNPNDLMGNVFNFLGLPYEEHEWGHLNSTVSLGEQSDSFGSPYWYGADFTHDDLGIPKN